MSSSRTLRVAILLGLCLAAMGRAGERSVRVFVALCDNATQGIVPVGTAIGNGDDPDNNLYWGCADGFATTFGRSDRWRVVRKQADVSVAILRRLELLHVGRDVRVVADAYRGSRLQDCLRDFERAAASGKHDLVAFIGHNGLMDFRLPESVPAPGNRTDAMVLCCRSDRYFGQRLVRLGCRPVLATRQNMYPAAVLLHVGIEVWRAGGSPAAIRHAAARAYADNQDISPRAASGVFADLVQRP